MENFCKMFIYNIFILIILVYSADLVTNLNYTNFTVSYPANNFTFLERFKNQRSPMIAERSPRTSRERAFVDSENVTGKRLGNVFRTFPERHWRTFSV